MSRGACYAALPEQPNAPYSSVRGDEAKTIRASELQRAVDGGVLVAAGMLGAAALSLVVRGLIADAATSAGVKVLIGKR